MPDKSNNPFQFWEELKRRRVIRVIPVYAAAAFVLLELVDIISEPFGLPDWTISFVLVLLSIGFVISVILSWVYDITPKGIEKTKPSEEVTSSEKQTKSTGWKITSFVSILIIIAFVVFYVISNIKQSSDISKLKKSIAVLPFENWSYAEEFSHLGNAIANEIITELYKIREFRVISHTSTLHYKKSKKTIPVIGQELGVNYIIEGIVERQKDNVNIHVQVIRAKNEDHIWAEEFEGEWKDIFKIQDEIALKVANELKIVLTENEIESIEKKPTEDLEAYNYYLLGNEHFWKSFAQQDWNVAINLYQKAIELDPNFASAYTMLAKSHIFLYFFHYDRSEERLKQSKKAIDVALLINSDFYDAHLALGQYYYMGFLNYTEALKHFETALKLMPGNAECIYMMAAVYRRKGEWEKSKVFFEEASKNDPRNARIVFNTGQTYRLTGEYSRALQNLDLTISLSPGWGAGYSEKITLLLKRDGNTASARKTLENAVMFVPSSALFYSAMKLDIYDGEYESVLDKLKNTNFNALDNQFFYHPKFIYFAMVYDLQKDHKKANQYYNLSKIFIEEIMQNNPNDPRLISTLGICYAGLGQKEQAIRYGRKGVELLPVTKEAWKGIYRLGELAQIYVMVGEYELAVEQLDYLLSIPGILSPGLLQLDPIWKPLWNHPEFIQLMEKYAEK